MAFITDKEILEKFSKIKGWEVSYDRYTGTLSWGKVGIDNKTIFATPSWEKEGEILVDFVNSINEEETYQKFATVRLLGDTEKQLEIYRKIIELAIEAI